MIVGLWEWLGEEVLRSADESDEGCQVGAINRTTQAMSEEQLKLFQDAVKADAGLQEKLKGAADLDAAVVIAKEAGFDVSQADWLNHQAKTLESKTLELSEEELGQVTGGAAHPSTLIHPPYCGFL